MFYSLKLYLRDWWITSPLIVVFLLQIFIWFHIIINIKPALGQIFLHYNIIFGVDLVGSWWKIFYLPLVGLLILVANCIVSFLFFKADKFLSRLLVWWILFVHCFLLIAIILLVGLNI